jgi:hypothetical protein
MCEKERGGSRKSSPGSTTTSNTILGFLYDIECNTQLVSGRAIRPECLQRVSHRSKRNTRPISYKRQEYQGTHLES